MSFAESTSNSNANKTKSKNNHRMVIKGGKTFSFETDEINKINCVFKKYFLECGLTTESSGIN